MWISPASSQRRRRYRLMLPALILLWLAGCASAPFDYPKTTSSALPPSIASPLAQAATEWSSNNPEKSGFVGLAHGVDALGARLRMMELAQQTIHKNQKRALSPFTQDFF